MSSPCGNENRKLRSIFLMKISFYSPKTESLIALNGETHKGVVRQLLNPILGPLLLFWLFEQTRIPPLTGSRKEDNNFQII